MYGKRKNWGKTCASFLFYAVFYGKMIVKVPL